MRILIDCCLSQNWVPVLNAAGHDSVHWRSVGVADAPDDELFEWAAINGHVVMTHDLDFGAMLATRGAVAPSVLQIRAQSHMHEDVGDMVLAALAQFETELTDGAIVTVDTVRAKVRALPLT